MDRDYDLSNPLVVCKPPIVVCSDLGVKHTFEQVIIFRKLKRLHKKVSYPFDTEESKKKLSFPVFVNSSSTVTDEQIGCIVALLFDDIKRNLVCFIVVWLAHKSGSLVKSI